MDQREVTWIFTDQQSSLPIEAQSAIDHREAAATENIPFFSIILLCDLAENLRRVKSPGRGDATTKLTDVSIVQNIRETEDVYHFKEGNEVEIDVTHYSPSEAAKVILKHVAANRERNHAESS